MSVLAGLFWYLLLVLLVILGRELGRKATSPGSRAREYYNAFFLPVSPRRTSNGAVVGTAGEYWAAFLGRPAEQVEYSGSVPPLTMPSVAPASAALDLGESKDAPIEPALRVDNDISGIVRHLRATDPEEQKELANDPYTRSLIVSGVNLIDRELSYDPDGTPGHLRWLSAVSVAENAERMSGLSVGVDEIERRWASHAEYLADLISYALWSRRWGHDARQAEIADRRIGEALASGDVVDAIHETAFSDLMSLMQTPAYRFQVVAATTAEVHPVVREALGDMYREVLSHWSRVYDGLLENLSLRLRPGLDTSNMADALAATAEGVAIRLLADPKSTAVNYEDRTSVLGTVALSLLIACVDLGDGNSLEQVVRSSVDSLRIDARRSDDKSES